MQRGTTGNDAMKNIHTYQCKLVQAMAFMSIGGLLKKYKISGPNFVEIKVFAQGQGSKFTNRVCSLFSCLLGVWLPLQRPVLTWCSCARPRSLLILTLPF